MLVSERLHRKETDPFIKLPHWNEESETLQVMEISEKQLKGVSYGMNVAILDVNLNPEPEVKSNPPKTSLVKLANLSKALRLRKKKKENKIVVILKERDQLFKLLELLPPGIRTQETDFFTYNVKEIEIPGAMEKLDDCVEQYFGFLSFLKRHNIATTLNEFKRHLNRNGNNIYSFLKIQVRFTGINSLSDMLTKYIKSSKCNNPRCPNFSRTKCSKCKTAVYCSAGCQQQDWTVHRQKCDKLRSHKAKRIDAFKNMITEIAALTFKSGDTFLTFQDFHDRIRPFAFSGYYDFILKETFLLGAIKYSSEQFSNIEIDEDTQTLAPLLTSSRRTWQEGFKTKRGDPLGLMMENRGRDWFFQEQVLMKKLFARGELDTTKIKSDEWIDEFNSRDEAFRKQFR